MITYNSERRKLGGQVPFTFMINSRIRLQLKLLSISVCMQILTEWLCKTERKKKIKLWKATEKVRYARNYIRDYLTRYLKLAPSRTIHRGNNFDNLFDFLNEVNILLLSSMNFKFWDSKFLWNIWNQRPLRNTVSIFCLIF